jgi:hypothetical protein
MELITDCSKSARDRGIVADHGRIDPQFPIGFVNPHDSGSNL